MRAIPLCITSGIAGITLMGCGASTPVKHEPVPPVELVTKETLYRKGHDFYAARELDSAMAYLRRSFMMDSSYLPPLNDLALLHYDLAMRQPGEKSPARLREFGTSYGYYRRMEASGRQDAEVYNRLTELSYTLERKEEFLVYARKDWEHNASDRQAYNLGLAYSLVEDHQNVIAFQKEAIQRFEYSPFLGGFYRLLGEAYLDVDRDQTAERTFTTGVSAVNRQIALMTGDNPDVVTSADYRRLQDDKEAMLLSLKKLHRRYGNQDKLRDVERQLNEAGH